MVVPEVNDDLININLGVFDTNKVENHHQWRNPVADLYAITAVALAQLLQTTNMLLFICIISTYHIWADFVIGRWRAGVTP